MTEKKLTGKIARDRIRMMETPKSAADLIEGFKSLGDATGIVSDIMDELGITGRPVARYEGARCSNDRVGHLHRHSYDDPDTGADN